MTKLFNALVTLCLVLSKLTDVTLSVLSLTVEEKPQVPDDMTATEVYSEWSGHRALSDESLDSSTTSDLLDFAIVGFPKCGTSFMIHHLLKMEEVFFGKEDHEGEVCNLSANDPVTFARRFQNHVPKTTHDGSRVKNAIKCPRELDSEHALPNYSTYFPNTKFVVTVRHPVSWFESFYNYRVKHGFPMTSPLNLIGSCRADHGPYLEESKNKERGNVCTDRAKFHHALSRFGKTPMDTPDELSLLRHDMSIQQLQHAKIFLFNVAQLSNKNKTQAESFVHDIQEFLQLDHSPRPLVDHVSRQEQFSDKITNRMIDICDSQYDLLRDLLVNIGKDAHRWIKDYFMRSPDVTVPDPDHFLQLLSKWQYDPCLEENQLDPLRY